MQSRGQGGRATPPGPPEVATLLSTTNSSCLSSASSSVCSSAAGDAAGVAAGDAAGAAGAGEGLAATGLPRKKGSAATGEARHGFLLGGAAAAAAGSASSSTFRLTARSARSAFRLAASAPRSRFTIACLPPVATLFRLGSSLRSSAREYLLRSSFVSSSLVRSSIFSLPRVISECHSSVQLNHFLPGFLSYSVEFPLKCQSDLSLSLPSA
jgi:hypothetical protein